jgi:hypothetical protein
MLNIFAATTFQTANEYFQSLKNDIEKKAEARAFVEGDDWRDGKNWTGPQFEGTTKLSTALKKAIEREFASIGTVKSTARRHRRGVVGRIPGWQITSRNAPVDPDAELPKEIQDLIGEAQKILNEFWKNSRVHRTVKEFVDDYLAVNRAILRLFFVQSGDGENGVDVAETVEAAVRLIHLFKEKPEQGIVVFDKETLQKSSFFRYEKGGVQYIEQCYIEDGMTIFRTLTGDGYLQQKAAAVVAPYLEKQTEDEQSPVELPLGGKLLVFEIKGNGFITPAMCSQQKLQNKAATMMSHNLDTAGFRSTMIINGMPPGEFKEIDGKKVFVPFEEGIEFGAGQITYVSGVPTVEKDAQKDTVKTSYSTPGVHESEPVSVTTFADTIREAGDAILEDADQKHVTVGGDVEASGESLRQRREDYAGSLEDTKSDLDDVMSEVLEAVLALVAYLMNAPDKYKDLQVTFNAILNAGPVSIEDRSQATAEADGGYRTKESAMELIGITDPDAMAAAVKKQQEENPEPDPKIDPKKKEEEK